MAGKAKFDQEAAFKSIIGAGRESEMESVKLQPETKGKIKDRVQRSYFLDRDIDKAIKRIALEEDKTITEVINNLLRNGVKGYL